MSRAEAMARLPTAMVDDLRTLHTSFGTRAVWISLDGETLLGVEPDRSARAVPLPEFGR